MSALFSRSLAQQLQRAAQDQLVSELVSSEPEEAVASGNVRLRRTLQARKPPSSKFQRGLNAAAHRSFTPVSKVKSRKAV